MPGFFALRVDRRAVADVRVGVLRDHRDDDRAADARGAADGEVAADEVDLGLGLGADLHAALGRDRGAGARRRRAGDERLRRDVHDVDVGGAGDAGGEARRRRPRRPRRRSPASWRAPRRRAARRRPRPPPIHACVSFVSTPTSMPAPMPAMPPSATEPATPMWSVRSDASTSTLWSALSPVVPWLTCAPSPMYAWTLRSMTVTPPEPATPKRAPPASPIATCARPRTRWR